MKVEKTEFDGLLILQPKIFKDERGFFLKVGMKVSLKVLGLTSHLFKTISQSQKKTSLEGFIFKIIHMGRVN